VQVLLLRGGDAGLVVTPEGDHLVVVTVGGTGAQGADTGDTCCADGGCTEPGEAESAEEPTAGDGPLGHYLLLSAAVMTPVTLETCSLSGSRTVDSSFRSSSPTVS